MITWTEEPVRISGSAYHNARTGGGKVSLKPSPDGDVVRVEFTLDRAPGLETHQAWQAARDAAPPDSPEQIRITAMRGQPDRVGHFATVQDAKDLLELAALHQGAGSGDDAALGKLGELMQDCLTAGGSGSHAYLPLTISMKTSADGESCPGPVGAMARARMAHLLAESVLSPCGFGHDGRQDHVALQRSFDRWSRKTKSGLFQVTVEDDGGVALTYQGKSSASHRNLMRISFSFNAVGGRCPLFWPDFVTPHAALLMAARFAHAYEAAGRTGRQPKGA